MSVLPEIDKYMYLSISGSTDVLHDAVDKTVISTHTFKHFFLLQIIDNKTTIKHGQWKRFNNHNYWPYIYLTYVF